MFLHLCRLKHELFFKGIQELVYSMYSMYLSHPQQVQLRGTAAIRAPCNPKTSPSYLEETANTSHSVFSFPHIPNESKREITSAGKEPSAFSKTAGKASAHLLKSPIFTLEEELTYSFSSTKIKSASKDGRARCLIRLTTKIQHTWAS